VHSLHGVNARVPCGRTLASALLVSTKDGARAVILCDTVLTVCFLLVRQRRDKNMESA
jgi:hypothetical protein